MSDAAHRDEESRGLALRYGQMACADQGSPQA